MKDLVKTPYVAWVDIGCFRTLVGGPDISPYELLPPPDFDDSTVGYSQVGSNGKRLLVWYNMVYGMAL